MPPSAKSPHSHGRSELRERAALARTVVERCRLAGARLRAIRNRLELSQEQAAELIGIHAKHLQRLERGTANVTLATLLGASVAYRIPLDEILGEAPPEPDAAPVERGPALPFRRIAPERARPFVNCVPLYPIEVAAGRFGDRAAAEPEEPEAWVLPLGRTRPARGLFVAQVLGESMNRRIPNGAYCVWRSPVVGSRSGRVVLAQHRDIHDPDLGGHFTVKVYESRKRAEGPDSWRHTEIRLNPDTDAPGYRAIVLDPARAESLAIVAELVEILPPDVSRKRRRSGPPLPRR